jgi:NAD+ synthase
MNPLRAEIAIALVQANPTARSDAERIAEAARLHAEAAALGADLTVLPGRFLAGADAVAGLARATADGGPALLVGAPWRGPDGRLYDAAYLLRGGEVAGKALRHAPDPEGRLGAGSVPGPLGLELRGGGAVRLGVMAGADLGTEDVAEALAECGAEMLVVLDRSPFARDGAERRLQRAVARVTETGLPLLLVNAVGGPDGLVGDGGSLALGADRRLAVQAPAFEAAVTLCGWRRDGDGTWTPVGRGPVAPPLPATEALWRALVLGVRDQACAVGAETAVLGVGGRPDEALALAVAREALGPARVRAVALSGTGADALDVGPAAEALRRALAPLAGGKPGVVACALEMRLRKLALLALSEELGALLLAAAEEGPGFPVLRGPDPAERQALLDRARIAGTVV